MDGLWIASHIALWLLVIVELLFLIALARHIGLLSVRIGPVGARMMNAGPEVGDTAPAIFALDLDGHEVTLGVKRGSRTLLTFVSPTCSTCASLVPALQALRRRENNLEVLLISSADSDLEDCRAFAEENKTAPIPYLISTDVSLAYQVQTTPYAILVDANGEVRAKGMVNQVEHLESLLNAEELGHASLENYFGVSSTSSMVVQSHNSKGEAVEPS